MVDSTSRFQFCSSTSKSQMPLVNVCMRLYCCKDFTASCVLFNSVPLCVAFNMLYINSYFLCVLTILSCCVLYMFCWSSRRVMCAWQYATTTFWEEVWLILKRLIRFVIGRLNIKLFRRITKSVLWLDLYLTSILKFLYDFINKIQLRVSIKSLAFKSFRSYSWSKNGCHHLLSPILLGLFSIIQFSSVVSVMFGARIVVQ